MIGILIFYSQRSIDFLQVDGVVSATSKPLKKKCCDKYIKKGKRCKRCPCDDLL
jgi:hypothetical protein